MLPGATTAPSARIHDHLDSRPGEDGDQEAGAEVEPRDWKGNSS